MTLAEESKNTRQKHTSPDQVLPAVSDLVADKQYTILRYIDLDGQLQELDYRQLCSDDPFPIPMPVDREGYGTIETSPNYWATGYGDWLNVLEAIRRFGHKEMSKLFDFGCATGRFLRHVAVSERLEPHGSDFAPANVEWVDRHFGGNLDVVLNTSNVELPYSDDFFDVVTAFSVFTHIQNGDIDWLRELIRITKPDGFLYLTIQNEATWSKVIDRPGSLDHLQRANHIVGNIHVSEELFRQPMLSDRIVLKMSKDDIYNCNVWTSTEYVTKNWGPHGEILWVANNAHTCFQSVVILKPNQ